MTVKPTEHDAKSTSTPKAGLLATLRALFGGRGSGAPMVHPRPVALASSLIAFSLLLCLPGSVLASVPMADYGTCVGVSHASMELKASINQTSRPGELPANWAFEYSNSESGPWTPVPGASGTVSQAEMEGHLSVEVAATFTGLTPEVAYYVRFTASGSSESTTIPVKTPEGSTKCEALPLGAGFAKVYEVEHITGTTAEVNGSFKPKGLEVHWRFEYATSEGGEFHVAPGASGTVLAGEENEGGYSSVSGDLSGLSPATVYYVRLFAEAETEPGVHKGTTSALKSFETTGRLVVATFAVHSVSGEDMLALGSVDPHGLDAHYHFEYVSQQHFEEQGFAAAAATPEVDAGSGRVGVGADLPGLQPGVTYHYRLFASSEAVPNGVYSGEQTLTVPLLPEVGPSEACPNEDLRIGPSAALPDCRAYEQVTPAEKHGAQDIDAEGPGEEFRVGEDGEHFMLRAPGVQWGSSPDAGIANYFFSRTAGGWQMTSATPQPLAAIDSYEPILFNPDLTEAGVQVSWNNSRVSSSPTVELQVGPPGGPYRTIASIPKKYVFSSEPFLVAAAPDLSKLIIGTEDRALVPGHVSTTTSGDDLYEYSEGQLRQVNVLSGTPGATIGTCGAAMARGIEGLSLENAGLGGKGNSSAHSVSAGGSRVFFYAGFGSECPDEGELREGVGAHVRLYERVNGVETVDIGEYKFLAANPQGSSLLLEHVSGETHEAFLYDTETQTAEHLFTVPERFSAKISADFSTIYVTTAGAALTPEAAAGTGAISLYRYDVSSKTLHYIPIGSINIEEADNVSANGRYLAFEGSSEGTGIPGGRPNDKNQIYRYDSSENVIECVSCASPFDPQPKLDSTALYGIWGFDGTPNQWFASENGDFVFFETPAALVPQDTDGEIAPDTESPEDEPTELIEFFRSQSSDVYEWRRGGVDGCAALQGCLALISGGRGGGYLNELLGATPSGRDVFFATHESLVPQDKDTAGDIYDARIGGGFPPPPPAPVECEGDSCATPFVAPNELTPAGASFQGAGDVSAGAPKSGKTIKKTTRKTKKKRRQKHAVKKRKKSVRAKRAVHRRRGGAK